MNYTRWTLLTIVIGAGFAAGTIVTGNAIADGGTITGGDANEVTVAAFSKLNAGDALPPHWRSTSVANISRHTRYSLTSVDGVTVLQAEADASMSSLARSTDIDPQTTPWLRWRWRVASLNSKSDPRTKQGDDFPVRIYVFFDYDLKRLPFLERAKLRIAQALYGKELPLAALCYVWASNDPPDTTAWNAYTDRVRMVVAASSSDRVGEWITIERNVINDYREAFGEPVPRITGIALATDTDNTGERSLAWYGDISFSDKPRQIR